MKRVITCLTLGAAVCALASLTQAAGKPTPPAPATGRTTVAKVAGDYANPVTALANLAAWCGTPSASNPCLVKILPGVYNIGSSYLLIPAFVDVEGSGPAVTKIQGLDTVEFQTEGGKDWYHGVVRLNGGNLRDLTVEALGAPYDDPYAIEVRESACIENVGVIAHESGSAVYLWLRNTNGQIVGNDVVIDKVTVSVPAPIDIAYGIEANRTDSLVVSNSRVEIGACTAPGGCVSVVGISDYNSADGNDVIRDTFVKSPQYAVGKSTTVTPALFDVQLVAPTAVENTGFKCYDVVDGSRNPIACP